MDFRQDALLMRFKDVLGFILVSLGMTRFAQERPVGQ
jgi:hypothetical protein